jgi:hypothetical protein
VDEIQTIHDTFCKTSEVPMYVDDYLLHKNMLRTVSYAIDNPLLFLLKVTDEDGAFQMSSFQKRYNTMREEGDLHNFLAFDMLLKLCHPEMTLYLYNTLSSDPTLGSSNDTTWQLPSLTPSLRHLVSRIETNSLFQIVQMRRILFQSPLSTSRKYVNMSETAENFHKTTDHVLDTLESFGKLAEIASQYTSIDKDDLCYEDKKTWTLMCHPIIAIGYMVQVNPSISPLLYKCQQEQIQLC